MSVVKLKFDNNLTFSDIEVPLISPQESEVEGADNATLIAQTMLQGVCTPIIAIGSIVFNIEQIFELYLYNTDVTPSIRVVLNDSGHSLADLEIPGRDNELRLQILPPFDDAYKKINLTFFIDSINISNSLVTITGKYKVIDLYSSRFDSFGYINTYDLFEQIAKDCKLGFATNCESEDIDNRYIYANNSSYLTLMNKQIRQSGNIFTVYDYWIDLWNNLNLVNVYERYHTVDPDEELLIWIPNGYPIQVEKDNPVEPVEQIAMISNNPNEISALKASSYNIINNAGKATSKGTDQVYTYYRDGEIVDTLVQDGSVKKDIFLKYEYLGENIGDFDYLVAKSIRKSFIDILECNKLEVTINFPNLALMRGHKCLFTWYENNFIAKTEMADLSSLEPTTNIPTIDQSDELSNPDAPVINKQITGQYLIIGEVIEYNRGNWNQTLTLVRPQDRQHKYIENTDNAN